MGAQMAKLIIHTKSGSIITAPFEAWVVALINSLPEHLQQEVFKRVSQLEGASLIPDKYFLKEDELGTIHMVEKPTIDLGGKI
jgi:hypothetical protein